MFDPDVWGRAWRELEAAEVVNLIPGQYRHLEDERIRDGFAELSRRLVRELDAVYYLSDTAAGTDKLARLLACARAGAIGLIDSREPVT